MKIALWIAQILLALAFGITGIMKIFQPINELALLLPWVADIPVALVRFIGFVELLCAIGLVLPAFIGRPRLVVLASTGVVLVMLCETAFHLTRGEYAGVWINVGFLALATFVAWGRNKKGSPVGEQP